MPPEDRNRVTLETADPRRWITLVVVMVAIFMVLLDISIVNVAIPSIQHDLNATFAQIQFVIVGYALSYGVLLITGGRLGDIWGNKAAFLFGLVWFTLGSALCGLAQSPEMLVWSRVFQGVGSAALFPQVFAVVQKSFPPQERAKAFGIVGAGVGLATVLGPILAGVLINADIHLGSTALLWRPIFLVNLPIGIAAFIAAVVLMRNNRAATPPKLDIIGAVLGGLALLLVIYPLIEGRDAGWPIWAWIMMACSIPAFVIFTWFELWRKRNGGSPVVEPELFTDRNFVIGLVLMLAFFSSVPSFFLTINLFLQIGFGFTALHTGATVIPFAICSAIGSGSSIRLLPKFGKKLLIAGMVILVLGMSAVFFTVQQFGNSLNSWELLPGLAVCGIGFGFVVAPVINFITSEVLPAHAGSASGVLSTAQQLGAAIGIALVGVVFFGGLGWHANASSSAQQSQLRTELTAAGLPPQAVNNSLNTFTTCFHDRATESDPSVIPPSCPSATQASGPVATAFISAATQARQEDFAAAFRYGLLYVIAMELVTLALIALLPEPQHQRTPGASEAH